MPLGTPRELLERAMAALIDVFGEMRPILVGCVEGYPAALREEALRERLAAAYGRAREAGVRMLRRAAAEAGIELPVAPEVLGLGGDRDLRRADDPVAGRSGEHARLAPGGRRARRDLRRPLVRHEAHI